MRYLLDSHVVLWWLEDNPALGPSARSVIQDAVEVRFSAVTPWELGIKRALGKLTFPDGLVNACIGEGFTELPITSRHATLAAELPPHHRDPFDRMLIAQAMDEGMVLVSADASFAPYDVQRLATDT